MTTCKIVGCRAEAERENMCDPHYLGWLATGELPGPVKPGRSVRQHDVVDGRNEQRARSYGRAQVLEAADVVIARARKWAAHDEPLASALAAYDAAVENYEARYGMTP